MNFLRKPISTFVLSGLAILLVPATAQADILGDVQEGGSLTINGFIITNVGDAPATLTDVFARVTTSNFSGDATDFVSGITVDRGTCTPLFGVVKGFVPGTACKVNLTFFTPPLEPGEADDFGVSQITAGPVVLENGPVTPLVFEIQVNDTPEPGSLTLLSLGLPGMIALARRSKQRTPRR